MRIMEAARAFALAALLVATPAFADGPARDTPDVAAPPAPPPPAQQPPVRAAPTPPAEPAALAPPVGQTGAIALPQETGLALNVPQGYRFYSAEEAQRFLTRTGAPAPAGQVLGLLAPAGAQVHQGEDWATLIAYDPIGNVPVEGAARIGEPAFEADVRAARVTQSRPFEGFFAPPAFVEASPSASWAERAAAPGAGGRDLRHEMRLLGRNGVASLTTIGSADQLPAVQAAAPALMQMVAFGAGQRHADFNPASDRRSDFDVPGLVLGMTGAPEAGVGEAAALPAGDQQGGPGLQGLFPWIAIGIAALAGAGFLLMRTRRREEPDEDPNLSPEA